MKYLKYGFAQFCRSFSLYVIMIAELAAIMLALNIAIGSYNSRNMLYKPFEQYLTRDGWFIRSAGIDKPTEAENNKLYEIIDTLEGEYEIISFYSSTVSAEAGDLRLTIVNDDIYNLLCMPLEEGDYSEAVVTLNTDFGLGDTVRLGSTELKISGVLTENTYVPDINNYNIDMDVTKFYNVFQSNVQLVQLNEGEKPTPIMILPQSAVQSEIDKNLNRGIYQSFYQFVVCRTELTEQQREHNADILAENSMEIVYMPFSKINKRSEIYVNESLQKVIPIIVCVSVIAIFGILCCCSINVSRSMRNNAVLYVCGATQKDMRIINAVSDFLVVSVSLVISIAVLKIITLNGADNSIGLVLGNNNILVTTVFVISVFIITQIVSYLVFKKKTIRSMLVSGGF